MATLSFKTKAEAKEVVPILKALGAEDAVPKALGWEIDAPGVKQTELDAVLALRDMAQKDGERWTPAAMRMAVRAVTGRQAHTAGAGGTPKRRKAKDTVPAPETA